MKAILIVLMFTCCVCQRTYPGGPEWQKGTVVNRVYESDLGRYYIEVHPEGDHFADDERISFLVNRNVWLQCIYGKTFIRKDGACEK